MLLQRQIWRYFSSFLDYGTADNKDFSGGFLLFVCGYNFWSTLLFRSILYSSSNTQKQKTIYCQKVAKSIKWEKKYNFKEKGKYIIHKAKTNNKFVYPYVEHSSGTEP